MLRYQHGLELPYQTPQLLQMCAAQRICGTERKPYPVQAQWIDRPELFQGLMLNATRREIILAVRFDPTYCRPVLQQVRMMLGAKTDTGSQRKIRCDRVWRVSLHRCTGARDHLDVRLPPTRRSQVPFGSLTNSLVLPSLVACPAHACAAPAQSFLAAFATP